jgi:hypothetical protein
MDNEWGKKKSHSHIGRGYKPVGKNISCDMSQTQLHVKSPIKVCSNIFYSEARPPRVSSRHKVRETSVLLSV